MNSIIHSMHRGIGQDGNTFDALHLPTVSTPVAPGRAGLPVAAGTGFNWGSMVSSAVLARQRHGLGQYGTVSTGANSLHGLGIDWGSIINTGVTAAGQAYQATVQADVQSQNLQNQMLARGYYPYGTYPAGTMLAGSLTSSSMMPLLLIGGVMVVMMMARR